MVFNKDDIAAIAMESGAALAQEIGMVAVDDPAALCDGQQVFVAMPTGDLEFGMVILDTRVIQNYRVTFYRLGDTGRPLYEFASYGPEGMARQEEARSLLPEGSIIYGKPIEE